MKKVMLLALVFVLSVFFLNSAQAENYPARVVKLVTTHGAGSGVDICTRILAPFLQKELGQTVVVENMQGGGGRVARAKIFKETPNGYTLLSTNYPSAQMGQLLFSGSYDMSQFVPVYGFMGGDNYTVLYVGKNSKFKDYKSMLAASKKKRLKMAVAGLGSSSHLFAVLLRSQGGLVFDTIPYEAEQVLMGVISGDVDMAVDNGYDMSAENGQRINVVLQATDGKRSVVFPDVPTTGELGFPGMEVAITTNIVGPPGLPADIVKVLSGALDRATRNPEFQAIFRKAGLVPAHLGPEEVRIYNDKLMKSLKATIPIMQEEMKTLGAKK